MSESASPRRSGHSLLIAALSVTAILLLAVAVLQVLHIRSIQQHDGARAALVQAARQEAVNLVTLDYTHLEADIGNVLAGATGDFRDQYAKGAAQVRKVVSDNMVRSTANVLEAGIVLPADADSATVLVVVDSTVRNKADPKGQLRHYRIQLQMTRQGGRWLASTLDFVS